MKTKIAAIDVGTTKVCTIMGSLDSNSGLRVLGVGIAPSHGIEKALVANASEAKESIRQSIRKAEMMAGYKMDSAYIGVTGKHIHSLNSTGTVAITKGDQLVRSDDLKHVLNVALNIKAPPERKLLHVIPRAYTLDGHEVKNPVGMHGYELNVEAHVITAAVSSVQNLIKCIRDVGVEVDDLVLEPLASAESVLSEEEKQAGVLIADIGGGTTDIAVIREGSFYHTSVLPVAGHQITRDIATGLGLSFELAEQMKKQYGSVIPYSKEEMDKNISKNGDSVSCHDLCDIMQARVEELMRLVVLELPRSDYAELIPAGMVITGGGANIPGIVEMTQSITHMPVRIGIPPALGGVSNALLNDPAYATSVGLILWKMKNDGSNSQKWVTKPSGIRGLFQSLFRIFR
jgi:cell division protein FtsA